MFLSETPICLSIPCLTYPILENIQLSVSFVIQVNPVGTKSWIRIGPGGGPRRILSPSIAAI